MTSNITTLNKAKKALSMLEIFYPWRHKRVDIIYHMRHRLYLAENKRVMGGKYCSFKMGWILKILSHFYAYLTRYCTPISQIWALIGVHIPLTKQGDYAYV